MEKKIEAKMEVIHTVFELDLSRDMVIRGTPYKKGDKVMVDMDAKPKPGDLVCVMPPGENELSIVEMDADESGDLVGVVLSIKKRDRDVDDKS